MTWLYDDHVLRDMSSEIAHMPMEYYRIQRTVYPMNDAHVFVVIRFGHYSCFGIIGDPNIINRHWFMAWCWTKAKPLTYCELDPYNQTSMKFDGKYKYFQSNKYLKMLSAKCSGSNVLRKPRGGFNHRLTYLNEDFRQHGIYRQHTCI